jgi:hypothetical protein
MKLRLCFAFIAVLATAAPSTAADRKDACTLLTAVDAEAALGEAVAAGQPQVISAGGGGLAAVSNCRYRPAHAAIGKSVALMARYSPVPNPAASDSVRASLKSMGDPKDVPGVGDSALWVFHKTGRMTSGQLNIFKGATYLIVTLDGAADEAAALDRAKALALKLIGRL